MDDRGYVAQALFDRLGAEDLAFSVLGDIRRYPESAPSCAGWNAGSSAAIPTPWWA